MTTNPQQEMALALRQIAESLGVLPDAPVAAVVAAARAAGVLQADRDHMLIGLEGLGWPCRLVELPEYTAQLTKALAAAHAEIAALKAGRSPVPHA